MSHGARELVNDDVGKKNSDGYKPIGTPKALKVINGQMKNSLEVEKMTQRQSKPMNERLIRRISCNYIPVTDPKKSAEWYCKHFNFDWNGEAAIDSSAMLYMREGAFFLIPVKDKKVLSFLTKGDDGSDFEMFTINFEVDDESIDSLYQGLKEDGTDLTDLVDGGICGRSFTFRDPDGHKFSVVTAYKG